MLFNKFDLNDLIEQIENVRKMGSIKDTLKMIPGLGKKVDDIDIDERKFDRLRALVESMTPAEREKPEIINPSRKRRIAAGSGQTVEDVNRLLTQYRQMQKMFKQLGGKSGSKKRRRRFNMSQMGNMNGFNI